MRITTGDAVVVADDDLERGGRLAAEQRPHGRPVVVRSRSSPPAGQRRRRSTSSRTTSSPATSGSSRLSTAGPATPARSTGSVAGPSILRTRGATGSRPPRRGVAAPVGASPGCGGGVARRGDRAAAVGLGASGAGDRLGVEHRVEVVGELVHQLLRHVADDPAAELGDLAGDLQVGA